MRGDDVENGVQTTLCDGSGGKKGKECLQERM